MGLVFREFWTLPLNGFPGWGMPGTVRVSRARPDLLFLKELAFCSPRPRPGCDEPAAPPVPRRSQDLHVLRFPSPVPTIHLVGNPHGWTTNQRPQTGPVRAAAAEAWRKVGPYRGRKAHLTAQFRFPWQSGGRLPDTDSVSWAAKVALDGAVDAGLIPDDSGRVVASVTLLAPVEVEKGAGLLLPWPKLQASAP